MKVSIRMVILSVLILSILFVSMGIVYTVNDTFNGKLKSFVINDVENVVERCKEEVTGSLLKIQGNNDLLSVNERLVQILHTSTDDAITNNLMTSELTEYINIRRNSLIGDIYGYSCYFFVNSALPLANSLEDYNNKTLVSDSVHVYNDKGLEKKEWYRNLVESNRQICIFEDDDVPQYVFLAQIVRNGIEFGNEILGVSVVGIDFENILRRYGNIEKEASPQIMIVNACSKVICTNDESVSTDVMDFAVDYIDNPELTTGTMMSVTINDTEYFACVYSLDFDMTLVSVIPQENVFITLRETTNQVYVLVVLFLIVALIIAVVLAGLISKPIIRFSDYIKEADENTTIEGVAKESRIREIDILYDAFGSMIKRIKRLLVIAQKLGEQKKETEFRMLQAQINPHYLYNALDSIAWMALRRGEEDIADLVSSLADSFRYNARTSEMIIDLKSEMQFINNYVELQTKFRKGSFSIEFDVDENLDKLRIPKFILQPLVENSIIHGLKRESISLDIKVSAIADNNMLKIKIKDNGMGFDADMLNRYLEGNTDIFDTEKIGIINIHKRLKNKYGKESGLHYESNEFGGITAIVSLPINEGEKNSEIY